jgi:hypothetical protein
MDRSYFGVIKPSRQTINQSACLEGKGQQKSSGKIYRCFLNAVSMRCERCFIWQG